MCLTIYFSTLIEIASPVTEGRRGFARHSEKSTRAIGSANSPLCSTCGGILRPNVIFFGETLDLENLKKAYAAATSCDLLLAVGSSLVVYPAADIPMRAKQSGARLAIVNLDGTPLDSVADYVIDEAAGSILPKIVQQSY